MGNALDHQIGDGAPTVARYAYATVCVLVALLAAVVLRSFDLEGFVFVVAVAVAVWVGGRGPGALAVVLSVLALHFVFIAPIYTGAMPHTIGYFVVFTGLALLITMLSEGRHRAELSLRSARDELEVKVVQRTEDLQRKQELLDLAQKSARAMAFDWHFQQERNAWSPEQEALYGLRPGAFDGRYLTWKKLIHPADWPLVVGAMARAREDGEIAAEFRVIWSDGTVHWLAANGRLFVDDRGEPYRMVGFTSDVTARKLVEEDLRRSEAYLAEGERLGRTGSWAFDVVTQQLVHSSDEHRRLFGFDPGAGMPARDTVHARIHPEDRATHDAALAMIIAERAFWEGEYRILLPDGTVKYVTSVAHPIVDAADTVVEVIGTTMDVTDRKRAEEALRASEDDLRETQAALAHVTRVTTLGEVTASLAHELNQPLAAIANNAGACLALLPIDRDDLDEVRAGLDDIIGDAERARVIMERVRGLAKRSSAETLPLALGDVVADVVALAAAESAARSVAIRTHVAANLPTVLGDRVQLQQVLLNLVINGMDAMTSAPEPTRSLEIHVQVEDHEGIPSARVGVSDRGVGLDAVQRDRMFEAFYTTKPQGMGMGLAISRSIIEAHGGRLWAEANDGPGATFYFLLPAAD